MNLFVQGMRRSGTTVVYDALSQDLGLECHYEPLREQRIRAQGAGGKRAQEGDDVFARTRALREEFHNQHYPELEIEEFNWGGPRDPALELEADLPEHCRELLRHLLEGETPSVIKETRLHSKVDELARLDPGAAFVHTVRDPRAVAASTVLGPRHRRLEEIGGVDEFFEHRSERGLWAARGVSEALAADPAFAAVGPDPPDVVRVLMVWRAAFERTDRAARERFGDRYLLLRNEDLRSEPLAQISEVYRVLVRELPGSVADWAAANVSAAEEPFAADDRRWAEAFERLEMRDAIAAAGYAS